MEQDTTTVANVVVSDIQMSPTVGKIAEALAKAQMDIIGAVKDSNNPFFKSKYSDLASVWDACHKQLNSQGIGIVQLFRKSEDIVVDTLLIHSSGEWLRSTLEMKPKTNDPQGKGSASTYARRYALAAITGVCPLDDDGEAAMGRTVNSAAKAAPQVIDTSVPANKSQEANRLMAKPNPMIKPAA